MSNAQKLKDLNAQKKAINEQQKALREELAATSESRKEGRKIQAQGRKDSTAQKSKLRDLTATVWGTFSEGDSTKIIALADEILEAATELSATVRAFGESLETDETSDTDEL